MSIKKRLMTACAGVLVAGGLASVANATLTIDLKVAPGVTGTSADGKWVARQLVAGEQIPIEIYATVSGKLAGFNRTAVEDEYGDFVKWQYQFDGIDGLQSLSGSVMATQVSGGAVVPSPANKSAILAKGVNSHVSATVAWDGEGATGGLGLDLNGDGVFDRGSPDGTSSDLAGNYVNIRGKGMTYDEANPSIVTANTPRAQDAPSMTFLVGKIAFRVGIPVAGIGLTDINWALRRTADGRIESNAGLWMEDRFLDGAPQESDPMDGVSGAIIIGGPVHLGLIPEPMSLSVFGVGAALLGLRRNRR